MNRWKLSSSVSVSNGQAYPVVPEGNGVSLPFEAHLVIGVVADLTEKEVEDGIRFSFRHANDTAGEA